VRYVIEKRDQREVNTDPQRRCYWGVHARSEMQWSPWETLESWPETAEKAEERLAFWSELNEYAVRHRGEGARSEYRIVETP
jgi:hypothetical protein